MTWNIEGWGRNCFNLQNFTNDFNPDIIFLSESQCYQCDISSQYEHFRGSYSFHLNSEDVLCPDLPLDTRKAIGGTMIMWRSKLDPYVKVLPASSSSSLPILLSIPGLCTTAHIAVYLPTSGKESEFITALAALEVTINMINEEYPCPIYIRGDCNVNPKNKTRAAIFKHFCEKHKLSSLDFHHPTHHHFIGDGLFDTQLDVLLYAGPPEQAEEMEKIICRLENPLVESHHDVIISTIPLPRALVSQSETVPSAPRVPNNRVKIIWDDDNTPLYQSLLSNNLSSLRERWANASSPACVSMLLSSTNDALMSAATASNRFVRLGVDKKAKPTRNPEVEAAQSASLSASRFLQSLLDNPNATPDAVLTARKTSASAKATLQRTVRSARYGACYTRDSNLFSILEKNPSDVHNSIKKMKATATSQIQKLTVGDKTFPGSLIPDGFYSSLSSLKAPDMSEIHASPSYKSTLSDYQHILKICGAGINIPEITPVTAMELLHGLKPDVNDLYSITPRHYINAGMEGAKHFSSLLNIIIKNVNLSSLEDLNSVWAVILHKGHGKDKESDRSYRTISTCPLLAKALDKYVGSLYESGWIDAQADTQFQGPGSSHELAALLLTECIQFSLYSAKKPLYCIFLDAKSAFDKILREFCIKSAYFAGSDGKGLLFLDNRLKNRHTFIEWDKTLMGPVKDKLGVEQGGINSDRLYKLANNKELIVTQQSDLGLHLGDVHCAGVGQADDVFLLSDDIHKLQCILQLAMDYANEYHVEMVPEKTKLLCYTPRGQDLDTYYWRVVSPITMDGIRIGFSEEAEHVGILRSTQAGNMANLLSRESAHTKAVHAVLPAGLARGHLGNPAAALRVEKLYGVPVLLSGLGALVLSKTEEDSLDQHFKVSLESFQRLYKATPAPVVHFLAGSLPASELLHIRQLSLLGMIARLGHSNILHKLALQALSSPTAFKNSWFLKVKEICQQYSLPDPESILTNPPSSNSYKQTTKQKVLDFWNSKMRDAVKRLDSLDLFKADYMSLCQPHPIWTTAGSSPFEVKKATVQARMLSGRYRTCWLRRHWSGDSTGHCQVPGCTGQPGTLQHIATGECAGLADALARAVALWKTFLLQNPLLLPVVKHYSLGNSFLSFLLDPTTKPLVISLTQTHGSKITEKLCYMTRTWLFYMHKERLKQLGFWKF